MIEAREAPSPLPLPFPLPLTPPHPRVCDSLILPVFLYIKANHSKVSDIDKQVKSSQNNISHVFNQLLFQL